MRHYLILLILITSCTTYTAQEQQTIEEEISRLAHLVQTQEITLSDLDTLKEMLKEDHEMEHNLEELEIMVEHKEYKHAGHALGFIGDYITSGKPVICPAHDVAHYYVMSRHDRMHEAEHALEEAEEELDEWVEKAKEYNELYPTGQDIDALAQRIRSHISQIKAGNTVVSEEEIDFLATTASICVEE